MLAEATSSLGGRVNLAARAPYRATIGDITDWLARELYRLEVEIRLNTFVDADDIANFGPGCRYRRYRVGPADGRF